MKPGTKPILLVEDNPDDVELTKRAFKKNNMMNELQVARDGAEALALLFDQPKVSDMTESAPPALILLDLKLPKVNGLEVLRRIREDSRTKLIPVVILTSSKEEEDVARGYGLGANSYIRKPVDFGQFMDVVRQIGLYWLLINEPPPPGR